MTKDLFIIRHANAEPYISTNDFSRKLSEHGIKEGTRMSQELLAHGIIPQLCLTSPATRAMSTCKLFAETLSIPFSKIQPENMIYEASVPSLLSIINHIQDKYKRVALFGHNPGVSNLVNYITEGGYAHIPTAGIIHIRFDLPHWSLISEGMGEIIWHTAP